LKARNAASDKMDLLITIKNIVSITVSHNTRTFKFALSNQKN